MVGTSPMESGKGQSHHIKNIPIIMDGITPQKYEKTNKATTLSVTPMSQRVDHNEDNAFGRSKLMVRSPIESTSISDIFHTPTTTSDKDYERKRKRGGEDSIERHLLPKSRCLEHETISKLERLVIKLCNSVAGSSNTKKEIRDISSKLRSVVAELVDEKSNPEVKSKSGINDNIHQNDAFSQTEPLTIQNSVSTPSDNAENRGQVEMKDSSTQTEILKKNGKAEQTHADRITEMLNCVQQEEVIELLAERWPGSVYTKTKTIKGDFIESITENGAVIFMKPNMDDEEDIEVEPQNQNEMEERMKKLVGRIQLKHGGIARISTAADVLTENVFRSDSKRCIYALALDPKLEYKVMLKELMRSLDTLKNYSADGVIPKLLYGTTISKAASPLRKILEYIGRKENREIEVYGLQREKKKEKISEPATKNEWQAIKNSKRKRDTIVVKPNEGVTYADLLKSMKKEVDPQKIGVQVLNVKSTTSGNIRIQVVGGDNAKLEQLKKEITDKVAKSRSAELEAKETTIIVRDLDISVDREDIVEAIEKEIGNLVNFKVTLSENINRAGYRHAYVNIPMEFASKLLKNRRICVGWSRCRIEEQLRPRRCFRCQRFGHIAYKCKNTAAKTCLKCGGENHMAAGCKEPSRCIECQELGHRADSMQCPKYKQLVDELRGKAGRQRDND